MVMGIHRGWKSHAYFCFSRLAFSHISLCHSGNSGVSNLSCTILLPSLLSPENTSSYLHKILMSRSPSRVRSLREKPATLALAELAHANRVCTPGGLCGQRNQCESALSMATLVSPAASKSGHPPAQPWVRSCTASTHRMPGSLSFPHPAHPLPHQRSFLLKSVGKRVRGQDYKVEGTQ